MEAHNIKQILKHPLIILFALFIFGLSFADIVTAHREFSPLENRYLSSPPRFSIRSLLDNSFSMRYEDYISDQFIGRDSWITLKSRNEQLLFKIENNGIIFGGAGQMLEKYTSIDLDRFDKNVTYLYEFFEMCDTAVTLALIPNSYMAYSNTIPTGLKLVDQDYYINRIYAGSDSYGVSTIDIASALYDRAGEYIYYRTDHHWTSLGAYYAYLEYSVAKALNTISNDIITSHIVDEFYGTYYSKSKRYGALADQIMYYDIPVNSITIDDNAFDGLYDYEKFSTQDKYAAFLHGINGLTIINSNNNLNRSEGKATRILIIKDSFANCFSPFMTYAYDELYIVDLRAYSKSLAELLETVEFDDVLVLYSFINFATETNLPKLRY